MDRGFVGRTDGGWAVGRRQSISCYTVRPLPRSGWAGDGEADLFSCIDESLVVGDESG